MVEFVLVVKMEKFLIPQKIFVSVLLIQDGTDMDVLQVQLAKMAKNGMSLLLHVSVQLLQFGMELIVLVKLSVEMDKYLMEKVNVFVQKILIGMEIGAKITIA